MSRRATRARIRLQPRASAPCACEPLTVGLAVPRGTCTDPRAVRLFDGAGSEAPVQVVALERWSDGSARWLLLDFQARVDDDTTVEVAFDEGASVAVPAICASASFDSASSAAVLESGVITLRIGQDERGGFLHATSADRPAIDLARGRLIVRPAGAEPGDLTIERVEIETSGPLRVAARVFGVIAGTGLRAACRVEVFAGLPVVRMRVTLHNPNTARHPGGFWELGDAGSMLLEHAALVLDASSRVEHVRCSVTPGSAPQLFPLPFRLHQESSGQPNWQSTVHITRTGAIAPRYSGYRLAAGGMIVEGAEATPIVHLDMEGRGLSVASRLFWEVFPKAYAVADDGVLSIELLPADRAEEHELQGGEQFSHEVALAFGADPLALDVFRSPSMAIVDPAWWAQAGGVSHLPAVSDPDHPYEQLVRAAIDGDDTFLVKRDRIDEYGWRHYGDLYADHENGASPQGPPIVSHYNNQYDGIAGLLTQFMRSGDPRWWDLGRDLAAHVTRIDIYWTDRDKSAYNGGLFWHTYHYVDAGRASHRSYPKVAGVPGGGPSIEHNYSTGLLLHHLMTGDPDSREAVLRLARWTVDMDEGRRTVFRYLSSAPTGLASATGAADYHGPGRGPANAIHTLLNALRLTGDRMWLQKAEALIRRSVHPHDDIEALDLLDAERRWYYTVFLQALGRYLAVGTERGEEGETWRYARASLLHYARWMVTHEYPYLEKPQILEYPTETWAAQDMRKCEVFDLAAKYAETPAERARFAERARYFFDQSVSTLHRWPTRTWTRPVVLMLSYGYAHLWHEVHREELPLLPPARGVDFGQPQRFEPQKSVALRRVKLIAAGLLGTLVALAGALLVFGRG